MNWISKILSRFFLLLLNSGGVIVWIDAYNSGKSDKWVAFIAIILCGLVVIIQAVRIYELIKDFLKSTNN